MQEKLSRKEKEVVEAVRRDRVSTVGGLMKEQRVSRRTVYRALQKYGHYSSYNANCSYLSLKDIPCFDGAGLWRFRKGRFSRHGTLEATVEAVVGASLCGYTVAELEALLGVRVHNPISVLCRKKRLSRYYEGHHCVYISAGEEGGAEQKKRRQGRRTAAQVQAGDPGGALQAAPEGLETMVVIALLVACIGHPEAGVKELVELMQEQGVELSEEQIERVMAFYSLKKNRNDRGSGAGT